MFENCTLTIENKSVNLSDALSQLSEVEKEATESFIKTELAKRLFINKQFESCDITTPQEELDALLTQARQNSNLMEDEAYEQFLTNNNLTEAKFLDQISYAYKLTQLKNQVVPFEQVKQTYEKTQGFRQKVIFSVIRVKDEELAQDITTRLSNDYASFAEMAQKYSIGEAADQGGQIGPIPVSNVHPSLVEVFNQIKPGQTVGPIASADNTWIIVKLEGYSHMELSTQLSNQIQNNLFQNWIQEGIENMQA